MILGVAGLALDLLTAVLGTNKQKGEPLIVTTYDPWTTLSDMEARIREIVSVPTMRVWDSQEALELDSRATLLRRFEELQGDEHWKVTADSRDHLLQAAVEAAGLHWSDVYWRPAAALDMARILREWIDAELTKEGTNVGRIRP